MRKLWCFQGAHKNMMKNFIFILLISYGGYNWYASNNNYEKHEAIIMYSLTTCGNCVVTARALRKEGVEFTELFIDKDRQAEDELHQKMRNANIDVSFYYTPVMDIKGKILANNPKLDLILAELDKY